MQGAQPYRWLRTPDERKPQSSGLLTATRYSLVVAVTSAFWLWYTGSLDSILHSHKVPAYNSTVVPGANFYSCGANVETAKAQGCYYDILSNHWTPSQCIDQDAIAEYQSDDTWHGFADANHTQPLTIEEMGDLPVYWTNVRDHIVHCASLWKKQFRALSEGRHHLDSLIVDAHHTHHCADYLIKMTQGGQDFREVPIRVIPGFAGCHIKGG